jgi:hypothetical protein
MRIGCAGRQLSSHSFTARRSVAACQIDNLPRRGPPAFIPKIPTLHATSYDRIAGHPARHNSAHCPPTARPRSPPLASSSVEVCARAIRDSTPAKVAQGDKLLATLPQLHKRVVKHTDHLRFSSAASGGIR